jgi:beta-fructofuranosidase
VERALRKAARALRAAVPAARRSAARPRFHFLPPANWMNDPHGTVFHGGAYHLFYQHDPYAPRWGRIHWGHARSRDLVHWEHLPIALAPDGGLRERHCFSGCCVIAPDGTPRIFYTRVGLASLLSRASRFADQCLAVGDPALVAWRKHPGTPLLRASVHGRERVRHWRDPYVFEDAGGWAMVLAGQRPGEPFGRALLYRSPDLLHWRYAGCLARGREGLGKGWECPSYLRLGDRHVLVVSPYGPVIYSVGTFRDGRHHGETWRRLDHGRRFYATSAWVEPGGRTVVVGWVRARGDGWAGCLSLPRELRLAGDDALAIEPVAELASLRREHRPLETRVAGDGDLRADAPLRGECAELRARYALDAPGRVGFELRRGAERHRIELDLGSGGIAACGERSTLESACDPGALELRVFVDRTVIEVFVGGREAFTAVVDPRSGGSGPFEIVPFVSGARGTARLDLWQMADIGLDGCAARSAPEAGPVLPGRPRGGGVAAVSDRG